MSPTSRMLTLASGKAVAAPNNYRGGRPGDGWAEKDQSDREVTQAIIAILVTWKTLSVASARATGIRGSSRFCCCRMRFCRCHHHIGGPTTARLEGWGRGYWEVGDGHQSLKILESMPEEALQRVIPALVTSPTVPMGQMGLGFSRESCR